MINFSDMMVYSIGCSLPWGSIGICFLWVLQKVFPDSKSRGYILYSIPPIAGGLGSWTGFNGQSLLFPLLTILLWYIAIIIVLSNINK
jgi:hypothetical protein